jgi:HAD superfamily hydrolase (TIGR01484 family)
VQYKALIFDLDGTAIPNIPNGLPSDRLVRAVAEAKNKFRLSAATGRPITNAKPILEKLKLTDPCVISAGTQIIDSRSGRIMWEMSIDESDVESILAVCKPYDYEVLVRNELMGEGTGARERTALKDINVMYIMQCNQADGQAILSQLADISGITASGVLSWTGKGIDIHVTNREATKEHAIAELLNLLHLSKEEVIGVGDGDNDIHLFRGVGRKIAMGNATDLLKSHADAICESVDKDGLAKLIEELR